jgi:glyoxylase-like metal-dependent hydrolase (beta-lactamase superfamily II)
MRIADSVYVLPIPRGSRGTDGFLNLTLILDEQNGNMLIDAGLPGQAEVIVAALADAGIGVRDLKRIIFTHQDLDHAGSPKSLPRATEGFGSGRRGYGGGRPSQRPEPTVHPGRA